MGTPELLNILRSALPELLQSFGLRALILFGSFARGQARADSDVDLLAEFDRPASLFPLARLQSRLEQLTQRRVDLGTPETLRPAARQAVLAEARRVA
jgi:predicted nucleotidyltransferase